jgi:predicted DNA-binding transcriptional regulator YafY
MKPLTQQEQANYNILSLAMQDKNVVQFMYCDDDEQIPSLRIVEPFLIGDHNKTNATQLVGWCLNPRPSRNPLNWRLYDLAKMNELIIRKEKFDGHRPHYNPNDSRMRLPIRMAI